MRFKARITDRASCNVRVVPGKGLEPPHLSAHGPEPCASTNSATRATQPLILLFYQTLVKKDSAIPQEIPGLARARTQEVRAASTPGGAAHGPGTCGADFLLSL